MKLDFCCNMQTDVLGKIREKKLPFRNTLLPLFEAVVNSIHSIEDLNNSNGHYTQGIIDITVIRLPQSKMELNGETPLGPILDFHIRDNGIGFTKDNYNSFDYTNSTYKAARGGKGLGRFTWLRAYRLVDIESFYVEDEVLRHKKFKFKPTRDGIEFESDEVAGVGETERYTEVRLKSLSEEHQKWCNLAIEGVAQRLIEHCFSYFLDNKCPIIRIIDGENQCVVNDLFKNYTRENIKTYPFKVKEQDFTLHLVRLYGTKVDNKIHYCANAREVQGDSISNDIPEIKGLFTDENNERYSISAYVTGEYFDSKVNNERTEITFDTQGQDDTLFNLYRFNSSKLCFEI